MEFDSYSERLADLNEFSREFCRKPKKIQQKRFQIINKSMQMEAVSKIKFGRLNDEHFYFSNGIMSLPYGHPSLGNLRKAKQKHQTIHKAIQEKKNMIVYNNVLKQIFGQSPMFFILNSTIISIAKGWKSTKEQILNSS